MLASYDKIIKHIVEKFQVALAPLERIAKNQEIIIAQNKQVIELLGQLNNGRLPDSEPESDLSDCPDDSTGSAESEA